MNTHSQEVQLCFATPRKLPRADEIQGRVVVLDIAFAYDDAQSGHSRFDKVTKRFIDDLGSRLVAWIDHHDHERHAYFKGDSRFCLATKSEHPACPEMITPELVQRIGAIDTIVCHIDFDGLCAAAKWLRGGTEPYPNADADARAIDTRIGQPSPMGMRIDHALRGRPNDAGLFGIIVRHLTTGLADSGLWQPIDEAAAIFATQEAEARRIACHYERIQGVPHGIAFVNVDAVTTKVRKHYDKTLLLLLGQEREPIALVVDRDTVSMAAAFNSGINFLQLIGLSGGMPTRVSIPRSQLAQAWAAFGVKDPPMV